MSDFQEQSAFWRAAIELHQHSGQSIRQFCRVEGLQEQVFYRWRKQLRLRPADTPSSQDSQAGDVTGQTLQISPPQCSFVSVKVQPPEPPPEPPPPPEITPAQSCGHCIEVRLPNGIALIVPASGVDLPTLLGDLLQAC